MPHRLSAETIRRYTTAAAKGGPNVRGYSWLLAAKVEPWPSTRNPAAEYEWWDEEFNRAYGKRTMVDDLPSWLFSELRGFIDGGEGHSYKVYATREAAELAVCEAIARLTERALAAARGIIY
jgi:hypothetical protein